MQCNHSAQEDFSLDKNTLSIDLFSYKAEIGMGELSTHMYTWSGQIHSVIVMPILP